MAGKSMILNKKVCKRCYRRHGILWDEIFSGKYSDTLWQEGRIRCPVQGKVWSGKVYDIPIFISTFSTKRIPKHCEFFLEHEISAEQKIL